MDRSRDRTKPLKQALTATLLNARQYVWVSLFYREVFVCAYPLLAALTLHLGKKWFIWISTFETSNYLSTKRSTMLTVIKPVVFNILDIFTEILQNMIFINSTRDCGMSVKCPCAQHKKMKFIFLSPFFSCFFSLLHFVCL